MNDSFQHSAANAKPECPKCKGTGSYMYDHNHGTICEQCCKHDRGFWFLLPGYVDAGKWCCLAGCGFTMDQNPDD